MQNDPAFPPEDDEALRTLNIRVTPERVADSILRDTFTATYEELQAQLLRTRIAGVWRDLGNQKQFRAETGAILNWWESTKTLFAQGNPEAAKELMDIFAIVRGNILDIETLGRPNFYRIEPRDSADLNSIEA